MGRGGCKAFGIGIANYGMEMKAKRAASGVADWLVVSVGLALYLLDHVVDDAAVLVLRAEHDDLRVGIHLHIVPRRPVEKIVRVDRLPRAIPIGCGDLAAQDKSPVGALTEVAFQAL